jgi:hypothetical protein
MSYLPPHRRRPNLIGGSTNVSVKQQKQEHRDQFPCLRDKNGDVVQGIKHTPTVNWNTISFQIEEITPIQPTQAADDGWVNLSTYTPTKSTELTTKDILRCAEKLELNWRRYYTERDLQVPRWIYDNPYDKFEDFDRTIPYASSINSDSESEESSEYDDLEYDSEEWV